MQRSFIISLSQEYYSEKVCLSQYDSDYAVNFEVLDKGAKAQINGMTAYFEGTRCDGLSFRYTGTASDNFISFSIDTALTAVSGRHTGEIVLYDGSGLWFGSANVQILVEKAARPDTAVDADVTSQQTLLEQLQEIVDTAAETTTAATQQIVGDLTEELSTVKESFQHNLSATQSITQNTYNSLLTNLPGNTSAWTKGSWWNDAPDIGSYFYVYSFGTGGPMTTIGTQIAINPSTLKVATRRIQSGAWTDWVDNVVRDDIASYPVLYCFGDSLTQGAVWDSNQDTAYFIAPENDQIPTRIANAIGSKTFYNMGSSGARYVRQSGDSASKKTIVELIKEADLSTATVVVIGGGRNDSATALGTGATATANDGTICGAIVDVLEYLTTTYPKLQIVVFGVTPQPTSTSHAPSDIFTRVFGGGWSLNTFYSEVADVCERYGVPFIDWYGCTLMYRWGVLSGGYSSGTQNWSHPLSSDIYRQMGNYLGGRIASFYRG